MRARVCLSAALTAITVVGVVAGAPPALAAPTPRVAAAAPAKAAVFTPPTAQHFVLTGGSPLVAWSPTVTPVAQPSGGTQARAASPQAVPAGTSVGTTGLGIQPYFGTEGFALSQGITATVNLANGNLVLRSTDVAINGPGVPVKLDRFYNELSSGTGSFGRASVLSTGRDVGLAITSTTVTFSGPSGFTAVFTPTTGGAYTAPAGVNADLVKAADGTFTLTYRKTAEKLSFDTNGFLVSDVDRNGVGVSLGYTGQGTLNSIGLPGHTGATVTTGSAGIAQIQDSAGRSTSYAYDSAGDLTTVTAPDNTTTNYTYDSAGHLTAIQTPGGNWTSFTYDSSNRVATVNRFTTKGASSGDAATTTFAYPSATSTTETNPLGKTSTYTLDTMGRVTRTTNPLGFARSTTWTSNSDVATATDAMGTGGTGGNMTKYSYDSNNSLTSVSIPTGAATKLAYTGTSGTSCASTDTTHPYQAKCTTDPQGNIQSATYDTAGNTTQTQDTTSTGGVATSSVYQGGSTDCGAQPGQVCSTTNGNGGVTSFGYDSNRNGNVTTVTPPAPLVATTATYDSLNRLVSGTDGNGKTTRYSYDIRDRLVATVYNTLPNASETDDTYDNDGQRISQTDPGNVVTSYGYDALGRQISSTAPGPDSGTALAVTYDKAGNVTSYLDRAGTVAYGYDAANELTTVTEPGGSCPASGAGTGCTRFGYNANGVRTSTTYPGGVVQTATVDASGRPVRLLAQKPGGPVVSDLSYNYASGQPDSNGGATDGSLLSYVTTTVNPATGAGAAANGTIARYTYDTLTRLRGDSESVGANGTSTAVWRFSYDNDGNRTRQSVTDYVGGGGLSRSSTYNAADELTSPSTITYDNAGNQTATPASSTTFQADTPARSITYSAANQAVSSSVNGAAATTQTYLGATNNLRTATGGTTFQNGVLGLSSQKTGTATTAYTRTPTGGLVGERTPTGSYYYLTDNQGSVIGLVDATGIKVAGYSYGPYGTTRTISGTTTGDTTIATANPYRYTSGYLDTDTGLYKLGYRYYDPNQGRFTQPDPSGQEANRYLYTQSNPVNITDPTGLFGFHTFFNGVGDLLTSAGLAGIAAGSAVACPEDLGLSCVAVLPALGGALKSFISYDDAVKKAVKE